MKGFTFAAKPTVEICGKAYEFDITDNDMLIGITRDFPKIISAARDFQELYNRLQKSPEPGMEETVIKKNLELMEHCRGFIQGCLGIEEYNEIFSKRRPNSTEHINLCNYLYTAMMEGREQVLEEYLGDEYALKEAAEGAERQEDSDRP